jgi:hypothetical protein
VNKLLLGMAGIAAFASAGVANAAVMISGVTPGGPVYTGPTPTYDFDASTPPTNGGAIRTGTVDGQYAQPLGSEGNYYTVGPSTTTPGTIDLSSFGDINSLSFLWGSVDTYNTLNFLDSSMNVIATFSGADIINSNFGNQILPGSNPIVTFSLDGGSEGAFAYLQLVSDQNAFEIDDVAINAAVPEPGTWGLMLVGFAGIGVAMRRRRRRTAIPQLG